MNFLLMKIPLSQISGEGKLVSCLVDRVLDYAQVFGKQLLLVVAKQAFDLRVAIRDHASLAC